MRTRPRCFIGITDRQWFEFLEGNGPFEEINFWQPRGGGGEFRAVSPGHPFLFKLRYPDNCIVGGGFFSYYTKTYVSVAWQEFGLGNGALSLAAMRANIQRLRGAGSDPHEDYRIGCVVLIDPFFLPQADWIPAPLDWSPNIVKGKAYDLAVSPGRELWERVTAVAFDRRPGLVAESQSGPMFGAPTLFRPRLGQASFRLSVTDAYDRHCAVSGEKTLPVLQAAHIRPVAAGGLHKISNGILLRSDIHTLFDRGYVTVLPGSLEFRVSKRLKDDWSNGRIYYELAGRPIAAPQRPSQVPDREALEWHADTVFKG